MTVAVLRGLFEAAMARSASVADGTGEVVTSAARRGYAYVCRRCDVYGYLGPDDNAVCWVCEDGAHLDRR